MVNEQTREAAIKEAHEHIHTWERQAGPGHPLRGEVTEAHRALHEALGLGGCSDHCGAREDAHCWNNSDWASGANDDDPSEDDAKETCGKTVAIGGAEVVCALDAGHAPPHCPDCTGSRCGGTRAEVEAALRKEAT